jgi:hypothetical protein
MITSVQCIVPLRLGRVLFYGMKLPRNISRTDMNIHHVDRLVDDSSSRTNVNWKALVSKSNFTAILDLKYVYVFVFLAFTFGFLK